MKTERNGMGTDKQKKKEKEEEKQQQCILFGTTRTRVDLQRSRRTGRSLCVYVCDVVV